MIEPNWDECVRCPNYIIKYGLENKHGLENCLGNQGYPLPEWCPVKEEIDEYGPELGGDL